MTVTKLLSIARDKSKFKSVFDHIDFCDRYVNNIDKSIHCKIVSQNENNYRFIQFSSEASYNISRPINSNLMIDASTFDSSKKEFIDTINELKTKNQPSESSRLNFMKFIYTMQQCIGVTLDALPSDESNTARKLNGDYFEQLIRFLISEINIECVSGVMQVPIKDDSGVELFKSSYQHDLMIKTDGELKIIGSVKTSSKDRIDKVFMDKFLFNRLTGTHLPHIAVFLNDVQRKKTREENEYGINSTFLSGHFKAYTVKLKDVKMRWCDPVSGETKIVKKFLWLPLEIDFETRWLEEATIKYRYCDINQDWLHIEFLDNEGETK